MDKYFLGIWTNSFEKCPESSSFQISKDKVICCTTNISNAEMSLGIPLHEIVLTPNHYVAITIILLLSALAIYEILEHYKVKLRADSLTDLLCSPA